MNSARLILASSSPRRRLLLKQIGLTFQVLPTRIEETISKKETPAANVRRIALEKADEVAGRVRSGIILAADTIVVIGTKVLGKPRTKAEARKMLRALSGRSHLVYTGYALVDAATGRRSTGVARTRVWFRSLSADEIDRYVAGNSPMDKAGAYGIQDDHGAVFVERIEGDFYNVVGLPLSRVYAALQRFLRR